MSYIIPNTFLFNTFAEKYRVNILQKWNILEILDCTKFPIFESATILNTINTWQKGNSEYIGYRNTANVSNFVDLITKPRLQISKIELQAMNQNWGLAFNLPKAIISLVSKIKSRTKTLDCYFPEISQGLIAYDKYQGQTEEIISTRAYHFDCDEKGVLKKWLWGSDINRYQIEWNGKEYIDYCDGIANPRKPKFFLGRRILIREITNPSIFASVTSDELYNDPSVIIILDNNQYSIHCLLAILNSKLATFFHFNHAPKATKGAFPKILVKDIKEFPIPSISDSKKETFVILVEEILDTKKSNFQSDTTVLEAKIDRMVYELYGLTETEIAIIENN